MAQKINEIQDFLLETAQATDNMPVTSVITANEVSQLGNIGTTSKVGVFRKILYVVAVGIWSLQKLFDIHTLDIEQRIAATRPFTQDWCKEKVLEYQHGMDILETGEYDNSELTPAEIDALRVVKQTSVIESTFNGNGILRVKAAGYDAQGNLTQLPNDQLVGLRSYVELKFAAGISAIVTSGTADLLRIKYKLKIDSLILNANGARLDGMDDTPVLTAVKSYLKSFDFDGVLSLSNLHDVIKAVDGISDVFEESVASKFAGFDYDSNTPGVEAGVIEDFRIADSGYFDLDILSSELTYII